MIEPAARRLNGNGHEPFYRFVLDPKQAWSDTCAVRIPRRNVNDVRHLPEKLMRCHTSLEGRNRGNVWNIPTKNITVTLWLQPHNRALLDRLAEQLYDKPSPNYRHWLKPAELKAQFAPTDEEVKTVKQFLLDHNLRFSRVGPANFSVTAKGTVARSKMHSRPGFWQAEYCWDKVPGRMAPIRMSSAFTVAILALICSLRMGLLYPRT